MNSSCRKRRLKAVAVAQDHDGDEDEPKDSADLVPPTRDCSQLFVVAETLCCAWNNSNSNMHGNNNSNHCCVPCAYKIATFDVALDYSFCKRVPNQRPELCPRSTTTTSTTTAAAAAQTETKQEQSTAPDDVVSAAVLGYKPAMKVLTVGDGDFSFSLALLRLGCSVIATSYETRETVVSVYQSVDVEATLSELEERHHPQQQQHPSSSLMVVPTAGSSSCSSSTTTTAFSVDATNLRETLPKAYQMETFDRIVWNFPCSAVAKGQDGQNQEMEENKELVRRFVDNARNFLTSNGQIHINHKTKPPFNQWKLEQVALSAAPNVSYLGRVVLDRNLFPPYVPRKALDRKSFPCHDACTFIFAVRDGNINDDDVNDESNNNPLLSLAISDPSDLLLQQQGEKNSHVVLSRKLVAVTPDLIKDLRKRLLFAVEEEHRSVDRNRSGKNRKKRR